MAAAKIVAVLRGNAAQAAQSGNFHRGRVIGHKVLANEGQRHTPESRGR